MHRKTEQRHDKLIDRLVTLQAAFIANGDYGAEDAGREALKAYYALMQASLEDTPEGR